MRKRFAPTILLLLCASVCAWAQPSGAKLLTPVNGTPVSTEYLDSKLMGRKMPYNVSLPSGYSTARESGRRYPVVYLLHGLSGHFDNWTSKGAAASGSETYGVIIVTPEGEDGWYTDQLSKDGRMYESYIVDELIPEIDKRFRTLARRESRAIAGLSMGGYGAIKYGLKYPDMFAVVGSFSGALRAATMNEKEFPGVIGQSITTVFGPLGDERRRANDVFFLLQRAPADKVNKLPFIYLDCGTEDRFIQQNRDFASLLFEKKVAHEFRQLPGNHSWKYWTEQVGEFLRVSSKLLI